MPLEKDIEKIIGNIWFFRKNFKNIAQNKFLLRRARLIQDVISLMAEYIPEKDDFADRLVLDNFLGSIQRYLTGHDLCSIHLSSKSLEVALLLKISGLREGERGDSFGSLCRVSINRRLIKEKKTIDLAWNVVNRRNMTMHDAIIEQAALWVYEEWINEKLEQVASPYRRMAKTILKPFLSKLQNRLKLFNSLPDLKWYVVDRSFEPTRKLIVDFLEDTIGNTLNPISTVEGKGARMVLNKIIRIPKVTKNVKQSILYELGFMDYSARHNIQDVQTVLNELYNERLFRF